MGDFAGSCLKMQGYGNLTEEERGFYSYAVRFTPLLNVALIIGGLLAQSYPAFAVLSLVLFVGALFPGSSLFDAWIFNGLLSPVFRLKKLPPAPPPRRFAMGMGSALSLGAAASFLSGQLLAGYALGLFMLLASSAILLSNWCLVSWIYWKLRPRGPAP